MPTPSALLNVMIDAARKAAARDEAELEQLTVREREVLVEVAHGANNTEISQRLYMAEGTVKTHVGRLLSKLGARDRAQLVVLAYEMGLVGR